MVAKDADGNKGKGRIKKGDVGGCRPIVCERMRPLTTDKTCEKRKMSVKIIPFQENFTKKKYHTKTCSNQKDRADTHPEKSTTMISIPQVSGIRRGGDNNNDNASFTPIGDCLCYREQCCSMPRIHWPVLLVQECKAATITKQQYLVLVHSRPSHGRIDGLRDKGL